ncbi:diguanylate cyclase [Rheinheimera riviphila]|uniref:Diguanylate cyclase n=1 Tax=Rheinheimera riviphila TaxID=1834037 RepID=A0A437QA55_9GAMM|nr:diguanylate cyclase [Rheinheimera riviphila]RVU31243.1 diguanylate cyclase [Rheinheimera riviphila]
MDNNHFVAISQYIDLLLDAICVVDASGTFVFVSAGAERIFGYKPEEMIGRSMLDLIHPDDQAKTLQTAAEIMLDQPKVDFENRYLRKDGQVVHLLWSARWSASDQRRVAVARDITQLKRAQQRQSALYQISEAAHAAQNLSELYQHIHQIIAAILPAANFAILLTDAENGLLQFACQAAVEPEAIVRHQAQIIQFAQQVLSGRSTLRTSLTQATASPGNDEQHDDLQHWLVVPLRQQNSWPGALVLFGQQPYSALDQELLEFVSTQIASAIERKKMHDRLQHIALYDVLTGLPNRLLFADRLQSALYRADREKSQFAVLYLDLDKFKQVNDEAGHAVGDLLLQQAAERIKHAVRSSDTVARFGGDEFVVLLEHIDALSTAQTVAEKVRLALNAPFALAGEQFYVYPSIGISAFPSQGMDEKQLLLEADRAMYQAKNAGGNQVSGGVGLSGE